MRDEMLVMGLGEAAQTISGQALMLEEFLAREAASGKLEMLKGKFKPTTQAILLHGHAPGADRATARAEMARQ